MKIYKAILICFIFLLGNTSAVFSHENGIYIWQRNWNENIKDAINIIKPKANHFIVLCGDFRYKNKKPIINQVYINWKYLNQKDFKVTLAFRIDTGTSKLFQTDAIYSVVRGVGNFIYKKIEFAKREDINIVGIQFDYDCPTSKLKDYARFLKILKNEFQRYEISITALPTWLNSRDFKPLINLTSYYVLQLHSFEIPKDMEQAKHIFLKNKASFYISKASKFNRSFYVSLPTYGYEVAFSREGNFIGLRAETAQSLWKEGIQYKTVMTNPNDILLFIKHIKQAHLENFLGIAWFRLPIKSDEFNWDIKTLKAILENREPVSDLDTEIISSKDGLYEIYLANSGEKNIIQPVNFSINWDKNISLIYDVMGKYRGRVINGGNGIKIRGSAPKAGNKFLVAWFRNIEKTNQDIFLNVSKVMIDE